MWLRTAAPKRVVHVNVARQRAGHSDAAVPTEPIAPNELAPLLGRDARSGITVPVFPGRWILSAGAVASGLAAIGRAATRGSAAYRRADSLRGMR
jgi:hypothetical protein